jgi:hypothetical protein
MPVLTECSKCSRKLRIPDNLIGKAVKCPACTTIFLAQSAETKEAATVATPTSASPPASPAETKPRPSPPPAKSTPITIEPEDLVDDPEGMARAMTGSSDKESVDVVAIRPASRQRKAARQSGARAVLGEEDEDELAIGLRASQRQYQSSGLRVFLVVLLFLLFMASLAVGGAWYVTSKLSAKPEPRKGPGDTRPVAVPGQLPIRPLL